MNENVGASFGLSVLVVIFFAVALYQPEPPSPAIALPTAKAEPVEAQAPDLTPTHAVVARADVQVVPVSRRVVQPEPAPSRRKAERIEPRGPFTKVREGESLTDIAARVYGSETASKALWFANRDRLDDPDAPLSPGSILRTP